MAGGFYIIDHTADIGLKVWSDTCVELFEYAALGMSSLIIDPALVEGSHTLDIEIYADTIEELLFKWLKELLFHTNSSGIVFSSFCIQQDKFSGRNNKKYYICSKATYDKLNIERHESCNEIKAVTRHLFKVDRGKQNWEATIIFDL